MRQRDPGDEVGQAFDCLHVFLLSDVDPDFKRMKEEHLVKMASLRQEAELLKQQAEVEKMRKELKELRGESLPLEENRKVPVPRFCIEILNSPYRHLVSFNMRLTHTRFTRVSHAGKCVMHVSRASDKPLVSASYGQLWLAPMKSQNPDFSNHLFFESRNNSDQK